MEKVSSIGTLSRYWGGATEKPRADGHWAKDCPQGGSTGGAAGRGGGGGGSNYTCFKVSSEAYDDVTCEVSRKLIGRADLSSSCSSVRRRYASMPLQLIPSTVLLTAIPAVQKDTSRTRVRTRLDLPAARLGAAAEEVDEAEARPAGAPSATPEPRAVCTHSFSAFRCLGSK